MAPTTQHLDLLDQAAGCLLPLDQATSLPAATFTDPGWHHTEQTELFHKGWVAVARASELAEPDSFVTATIGDEPCIVVRDKDGTLRALSNVCSHRSSVIVGEPCGSARTLQCPYHLWTFGQDGQLRAAPGMDQATSFDAATVALAGFAVDEWHGFVLVNIDANAEPYRSSAPSLDQLFTENRIADCLPLGKQVFESPWNWKITVDNYLESYHHRGIHPTTIEPRFPGLKSFGVFHGDEPWSGVDHVGVTDEHLPFIALAAYPSLLVAIDRGVGFDWFRTEPVGVDKTRLTIESFALPEFADEPGRAQRSLDFLAAITEEDNMINERTAAGLKSKFSTPGRLSHLEASPWHFHRWLIQTLT